MADVVKCLHCGAKNRLSSSAPDQVPVCGNCAQTLPWLVTSSDASFAHDILAPVPVLADFWAEWCGPCRMIAPVLEELSQDLAGHLKIIKLDVDANPRTAEQYRVQSIPMLGVFKGGELKDTLIGAMPKGALLERLQTYL